MILMGDEVRRTQQGNNNAYCQNNELNWFDWQQVQQNADLLRFCQKIIAFRKNHPNLHRQQFFTGLPDESGKPDIEWHGCVLDEPGWSDPQSHVLAFTLWGQNRDHSLHIMLNMDMQDLDFAVPNLQGPSRWYIAVDTSQGTPDDIADSGQEDLLKGTKCHVKSHSAVVLLAK